MSYSNPLSESWFLEAYTIDTFGGELWSTTPPPGKTGRLVSMNRHTNSKTGGPTALRVGDDSDDDAYGEIIIPDGTLRTAVFTRGILGRIPENSIVVISEAGDADFGGSGDFAAVIEWS